MTTKTPTPVAVQLMDSRDVIVTKTHDVDAALEALLDLWVDEYGDDEDDALLNVQAYIDTAPALEYGRWVRSGSYEGEPCRRWKTADPPDAASPAPSSGASTDGRRTRRRDLRRGDVHGRID